MEEKKKKVVVAFSGGLDTSFTVMYLAKEKGYEVYAACANTGGFSEEQLKQNEENAYKLGAVKYVTLDVTREYYEKSLKYMVFGNVLRNGTYPISVSSERIFQGLAIARYANEIGADAIAHGSTGAGNDQIRFDMTFLVLAPGVEIITLTRDMALSRQQEIDYLNEHGFAASIYMRGIDFINCPTTTLSMIDSSIGGKTAVDLGETKNIVGSFWQPKLVIVDPSTLATLPRRQYINGLAESVKASLLADPELFAIFEKGDIDGQIGEIIYRSLRFKKSIVEQDETEHGMRKALNFGHTIGHGIEAVKGVKGRRTVGLYHGECVALGMLPMIESKALQKRVRAVYRRLGLPLRTACNKDKVYAEMLHDKKAQGGQITVIKVPGLGCWRAETIPVEGLRPLLGMED